MSISKRVIREVKKLYSKHLIETSENKTKTVWNIIRKVRRKAEKSIHLPHSLIMNNKEVSIVKKPDTFNNYFLNMVDDLQIQIDNETSLVSLLKNTYQNDFFSQMNIIPVTEQESRSQWLRSLRRRSTAARLLRSWV